MNETIRLVSPAPEHEAEARAYIEAFRAQGTEHIDGSGAITEFENYADWLAFNERNKSWETVRPGWVPGETFFSVREGDGRIVGMVNVRYALSDFLLRVGGHVGYSVRPDERRNHYASEMLRQALQTLKEKGIDRVLVTCNEDNIASAGVIRKNGGVYENSEWDDEDQSMTQRYWIEND